MNIWLILTVVVASASPILLKQYGISKHYIFLVLTVIAFMISFYAQLRLFDESVLGSTYGILSVSTIIIVTLTSYFYYKESLSTIQLCGIILGLTAVYMLQ